MADFDRLDAFNELIAHTLRIVLEGFPSAVPIYYAETPPEPFDGSPEYRAFLRDTVNWLVDEGVLHKAGVRTDFKDAAVLANPRPGVEANLFTLSSRGLAALREKVDALEGQSAIEALDTADRSRLAKVGGTISYFLGNFSRGMIDAGT